MAASDLNVAVASSDLPADVAYDRWNMELDEKSIPSCAQAGAKNLAINSAHDANCTRELMANLPWMKVSLPAMLLFN